MVVKELPLNLDMLLEKWWDKSVLRLLIRLEYDYDDESFPEFSGSRLVCKAFREALKRILDENEKKELEAEHTRRKEEIIKGNIEKKIREAMGTLQKENNENYDRYGRYCVFSGGDKRLYSLGACFVCYFPIPTATGEQECCGQPGFSSIEEFKRAQLQKNKK